MGLKNWQAPRVMQSLIAKEIAGAQGADKKVDEQLLAELTRKKPREEPSYLR